MVAFFILIFQLLVFLGLRCRLCLRKLGKSTRLTYYLGMLLFIAILQV